MSLTALCATTSDQDNILSIRQTYITLSILTVHTARALLFRQQLTLLQILFHTSTLQTHSEESAVMSAFSSFHLSLHR